MSRNFDSSQLTARKQERAIAGSFLTQVQTSPGSTSTYMRGSKPMLGIQDSSIMSYVKTGGMTEYTRYPTCVGISPGCPCPTLNASVSVPPYVPAIPGQVTGITFTVGSVVVSWNAPTGGPFTYRITPYLNGVALASVVTSATTYRFTTLEEWKPYTFTVCAINAAGDGPNQLTPYFIAPPNNLSLIMSGDITPLNPLSSLQYIMNAGIDYVFQYIASVNMGPTKGSRFMYLWITSVIGAWNWVASDSRITGTHDAWNWDAKTSHALTDNDRVIWLTCAIDYLNPLIVPGTYHSIYDCPADTVARVRAQGEWDTWAAAWQTWYNYRSTDGSVAASTELPTDSANWNQTLMVDGVTVNNIAAYPQPQQWTRLTVQGKKQGYLTYNWDNVLSSCLTESDEVDIQNSVAPATGAARDAEIDEVKTIAANLTDYQKTVAEFWAGGPGTVAPPQMCIWLWKEYMRSKADITPATLMFSLQDLGIHMFEGGRVTWRLKSAHMEDRPIQEIRRRYTGQAIASWNGTIDGAQWIPYQTANFVTPPFADFPSGHSHFSKAFALTMNKWFGNNIMKHTVFYDLETLFCPMFKGNQNTYYGDFTLAPGTSTVEPGVVPQMNVTLSFDTWDEMANSAGMSRLYGGIHAIAAHHNSQTVAVEVDGYINSTWNIRTVPI
jgi:hypothetical protein